MPDTLAPPIAILQPSSHDVRIRAREALRDALPSLIIEISWRLSEVLDKVAFATVEARADGSGHAPATMHDEAYNFAGWLAKMLGNAEELGLDWKPLLPSRLHVDMVTREIRFNVASS